MPVQLLVAPAASGKTHACLEAIRETRRTDPLAPIWVTVPDRLQAAWFRRRLAAFGGAFGVQIATFQELYLEILAQAGEPPLPNASPALRQAAMQAALGTADLQVLPLALREVPGFPTTLLDRVSELQRGMIEPADLQDHGFPPLLADLGRVAEAYNDILATLGWADSDSLASRAVFSLRRNPHLFQDVPLLILDGFDRMETARTIALKELSQRAARVIITLPGTPAFDRPAFRRFQRTFAELASHLPIELATIHKPPRLPPDLAAVEAGLMAARLTVPPAPDTTPDGDTAGGLELIEVPSPVEEAREALRWIKARITRDGVPPQECAVFIPSDEPYTAFLRQAAAEFGLALHFHHMRPAWQTPAIQVVLNVLDLALRGFPRRQVLAVFRSPYFQLAPLGIAPGHANLFELISRAGSVIQGLEQWQEVFHLLMAQNEPAGADEDQAEDGPPAPRIPHGEQATAFHQAFQAVMARLTPPDGALTLPEWITWLEETLQALGFYPTPEHPADEETQAALLSLRDCLRGMLSADAALAPLGRERLHFSSFAGRLTNLLQGLPARETAGQPGGRITVLRMLAARGVRTTCTAFLGLAEGVFPQVEQADPLLDEASRAKLGLPLRLEQDQLGLFYQAITRADRYALLTRPYLTEKGDAQEPSPYWNAVTALLPGRVRRLRPDSPRPIADAASAQEALFWSALRGEPLPWPQLAQPAREAQAASERLAGHLAPSPEPDPALAALVTGARGTEVTWSVSRFEVYAGCPRRFLLESLLKVQPNEMPEWDLDSARLGTLLHRILEVTYQGASHPADVQGLLDRLSQVARQEFARAPATLGFRPSPLWQAEQRELLERLADAIRGLANLDPEQGWQPFGFEVKFGMAENPPLTIVLDGVTLSFRGSIDRIDINQDGRLRVIDYKSGSSNRGHADAWKGKKLQLPIYALAAEQRFGRLVVDGLYYYIGKDGEKSTIRLYRTHSSPEKTLQGYTERALALIQSFLADMADGKFAPIPLDRKCPSYCAGSGWCWQYAPERWE